MSVMLPLHLIRLREMQNLSKLKLKQNNAVLSGRPSLNKRKLSVRRELRSSDFKKMPPELNVRNNSKFTNLKEKNKSRNGELIKRLQDLSMRRSSKWRDLKENKEPSRLDLNRKLPELSMKRESKWKNSKEKKELRK